MKKKLKLHYKLLIIIIFFLTTSFSEKKDKYLKIGFIGYPMTLDPALVTTTVEFNTTIQLFEGLTMFKPKDLVPIPGIAKSWNISTDGLKYVFNLRKNAKWSDGVPIDANTFKNSLFRALNPDLNAPYVYLLFYIKNAKKYYDKKININQVGIKVIDKYTLKITLENPIPFFLNLTVLPIFMPTPEHIIKKHKKDWTKINNIVNNGPFLVNERIETNYLTMIKNKLYWDKDNVKLDKIKFHYFEKEKLPLEMYNKDQLDCIGEGFLLTQTTEAIKKTEAIRFPILSTYFYRINVKHPVLSDVRVRKALYLAINRNEICRKDLKGGELPAYSFIPNRMPGYNNYPGEREDLNKARKLLAKAGYPNGYKFPKIKILYNHFEEHEIIAKAVQKIWKNELNIDVELDAQDYKIFREKMFNLDYDIIRSSWVGDYLDPSTFLDIFETETGKNNRTGWYNSEYAKFINLARTTKNTIKRNKYFYEAEKILINEAPIIPIYYSVSNFIIKPYIKGFYPNMMDIHPLKMVNIIK